MDNFLIRQHRIYNGGFVTEVLKGGKPVSGHLTIPESLIYNGVIRQYEFAGCRGLTSVTIPASVTKIGKGAFSGCKELKSVCCLIENPDQVAISGTAFDRKVARSCKLYVPARAVERYEARWPWNEFIIRALPE